MKRILFEGDSITDCDRSRDHDGYIGYGYPNFVMGRLGTDYPGEYEFINRGIGGSKIVDVYSRVKESIKDLKPDYMSIHIGVNDVWHEIQWKSGIAADKFEEIYDKLLTEIRQALPDTKIMLLGAYVTKSFASEDAWDTFSSEVAKRAEIAKKLAQKHGVKFVPLQERFDEGIAKQPEPYWTREGVHPTPMGHELIAREWLKAFEEIK